VLDSCGTQGAGEAGGELSGGTAGAGLHRQGDVGGEVAVLGAGGPLEADLARGKIDAELAERAGEGLGDLGLDVDWHGS
jgi:hypothetical protein